jgi:periplasmic protein TonB
MRDGVADVLAQRAKLDRGAASGLLISILLHGGLAAALAYAALHAKPPQAVGMVNIEFAPMPAASAPAVTRRTPSPQPAAPPQPKVEEPKPRIAEPKPPVEQKPAVPEKNTVPLSPFGQSTKKGSERPETAKPAPAPPATSTAPAVPGTTTDVPVGGSGVIGLEGGDFPHTIYIQAMHRRIGSNWFRQGGTTTATVIYFRIHRNGAIAEAKVHQSSGNATYDRIALSAVRSSTPLQPLPAGFTGSYLGVYLGFQ